MTDKSETNKFVSIGAPILFVAVLLVVSFIGLEEYYVYDFDKRIKLPEALSRQNYHYVKTLSKLDDLRKEYSLQKRGSLRYKGLHRRVEETALEANKQRQSLQANIRQYMTDNYPEEAKIYEIMFDPKRGGPVKTHLSRLFGFEESSVAGHFFREEGDESPLLVQKEKKFERPSTTRKTIRKPSYLRKRESSLATGGGESTLNEDEPEDASTEEAKPLLAQKPASPTSPAKVTFRKKYRYRQSDPQESLTGGSAAPGMTRESSLTKTREYTILTTKGKDMYTTMKEKRFKNVSFNFVDDFLKVEGFELKRINGSHFIYHKSIGDFTVSVPRHQGSIKQGTLKGIFDKLQIDD